jgi:oligopeptidase B
MSGSPMPFSWLAQNKKPRARAILTQRIVHDTLLEDDFAWLRAEQWQAVIRAPETLPKPIRAYLEAENRYAKAAFKPLQPLIRTLRKEMRGRMKEADAAPPVKDGAYFYFHRYRKGAQYPQLCRRKGARGRITVMLDGVKEAAGKPYFTLGDATHSADHQRLAWAADVTGSESYTIHIRDLATGQDGDATTHTNGDVVWLRNGRAFLYIALDEGQRPWRVMRHRLGTPQAADDILYEEAGTGWFIGLGSTQDDRFALISVHDHETSEVHLVDLADGEARPVCVAPRKTGVEYDVEHHEGRLILHTNQGGAVDFKIIAVPFSQNMPLKEADFAAATCLVPENPGRIIEEVMVLKDWLIWSDLGEEGPRVIARRFSTGEEKCFTPHAAIGTLEVSTGLEYATDIIRLTYAAPNMPDVTLDHALETGEETILKTRIVPSGHDPADYAVERLYADAADGARIPITLLRHRQTPVDGTAPALLYGYGAYGITIEAGFRTRILSLVDRGFVYAIAHVRGGMEKGFGWYRSGKLENKVNSFTDFIAVADHLVAHGYAAPQRIVAQGGSAGGLLMGAVANMAGEKFAGIIAEVPFVDCLNTILDESLPLTPPEWVEWGNPITDAAVFAAIRAYSPYDNITAKAYPPMLITAGLSDPRVTYWEPAKYVARLRATASGGPFLLHTEMEAGHGGASGRFDSLTSTAQAYAFALAVVRLEGAGI